MADALRYFHGGPPIEGRWLLPPTRTGAARACHDAPYVYLTTSYSLALTYAATCDGWVYEVVPDGPVEADPDSTLDVGVSVRCRRARIVRRVRPPKGDLERARRAVLFAAEVVR